MRGIRVGLVACLLVATSGCEGVLHGTGMLYVWNGTEHPVEVTADGRSQLRTSLRPNRGELFGSVVAGSYTVGVGAKRHDLNVAKERLTVVNVDHAGCFARTDVLGMYQRGKDPVRVLEMYEGQAVMEIQDALNILPGERLPTAAPRTPYPFQRLSVVPCHLVTDEEHPEEQVAQYVRRQR